ncbi:MAG: DNA gyrase modulator, partial [Gammaproteobacteria bacterium]|nr:DNA gyrase modulator [Gammaproteobacteria bacterium]
MSNPLDISRKNILEPSAIGDSDLERTLSQLLRHSVDSADLYFQSNRFESWVLEDGIVKDGSFSVDRGVGVRAISGERTGFAYAEDIVLPALTSATEAARSIARQGQDV